MNEFFWAPCWHQICKNIRPTNLTDHLCDSLWPLALKKFHFLKCCWLFILSITKKLRFHDINFPSREWKRDKSKGWLRHVDSSIWEKHYHQIGNVKGNTATGLNTYGNIFLLIFTWGKMYKIVLLCAMNWDVLLNWLDFNRLLKSTTFVLLQILFSRVFWCFVGTCWRVPAKILNLMDNVLYIIFMRTFTCLNEGLMITRKCSRNNLPYFVVVAEDSWVMKHWFICDIQVQQWDLSYE